MGRIDPWWYLMLLASSSLSAPVSENFAVVGGASILVQRNQTATLPCWLSPPQSAEDLEVRWYRGSENFDNAVMPHNAKSGSQNALYVGRVSFGLKDAASGGLKSGDVSLKMVNVTIQDEGVYTCFVSSSEDYGSTNVALSVTETGSPPLLSAAWKEDNMVEVSCESEGWYPQPELLWSHKNEALTTNNVKYDRDSAGLYSVRSWVLVSNSSEISCSVGLANKVTREVRLKLTNHQRSLQGGSESSSDGWVAFGILMGAVVVLAVAAALYFRKRFKKCGSGGDQTDGQHRSGENEALLSKGRVTPTALSEASKHYVNLHLVDTKNPLLSVKGSKVRDAKTEFPDGDRVTCLTAVRVTPGFSSGQHYWEVSLRSAEMEPKQSWWIGVTNTPDIPQDMSLSPNISNGFWFLSSSPDQGNTIQYSTEPELSLHVRSRPETIGVYLDLDTGELSFYNVEEKQLIISLAVRFTGEIFPLFNPGKGDRSVMEIIQKKPEQVESNDDNRSPVEVEQKPEQVECNDDNKSDLRT